MADRPSPRHMAAIASIAPVDEDVLPTARLAEFVETHGEQAAERLVCRYLEDVDAAVNDTGNAWLAGDRAGTARAARRLSRLAVFLGLGRTAAVAEDILTLTTTGQEVALAASVSRLQRMMLRLGDRAGTADELGL